VVADSGNYALDTYVLLKSRCSHSSQYTTRCSMLCTTNDPSYGRAQDEQSNTRPASHQDFTAPSDDGSLLTSNHAASCAKLYSRSPRNRPRLPNHHTWPPSRQPLVTNSSVTKATPSNTFDGHVQPDNASGQLRVLSTPL
jgi:hypothetical protein